MASRISSEKASEKDHARQVTNITDDLASEAEQFFNWRQQNQNQTTKQFSRIQKLLLADKAEEWNPGQLYILFLCYQESACVAAASRKFCLDEI